MLEYDSISTLKDDIIIMKNEIKKLTAVTFSALGILACSSASFCEGSSVGCFMHNKRQRKLKRDISIRGNFNSWVDKVYIACPDDEVKTDIFQGNLKQLVYPINTFDVDRFERVIRLNNLEDGTWNFYIVDNDDHNPAYGFCVIFIKGDRSVSFFFNPIEAPEKFAGSTWGKENFNLKTFFDNFEEFVLSFGFKEKRSFSKMSDSMVFQVPVEITCLSRETFRNFSNLKRIVIPSTVEKISSDTFEDCKNLESIFYLNKNYLSVKEFIKDFEEFKISEYRYLNDFRSSFNLKA